MEVQTVESCKAGHNAKKSNLGLRALRRKEKHSASVQTEPLPMEKESSKIGEMPAQRSILTVTEKHTSLFLSQFCCFVSWFYFVCLLVWLCFIFEIGSCYAAPRTENLNQTGLEP